MSRFEVDTAALYAGAGRLEDLPGALSSVRAALAGVDQSAAAAGHASLAGAMSHYAAGWHASIGAFAAHAGDLGRTLGASAGAYEQTDRAAIP